MDEFLETDYLVVGSGAMGMAFTDEIMTQNPKVQVVLVDRHARPGGHWNDAYPFVSLHQPAAYYGVNSEKLGTGGAALASGSEVLAYFERVLCKWLATGRLQHFPMCEYDGDGRFRSLVEPDQETRVTVRKKTVDAS
ncbi:MAG: NAD(P)-binding protein, partial [Myxococcota bacterium]